MSENTKAVTTIVPQNHSPRGKKPRAPPMTPSVPMMVMVSGLTPCPASQRATGLTTRAAAGRTLTLSISYRFLPISQTSRQCRMSPHLTGASEPPTLVPAGGLGGQSREKSSREAERMSDKQPAGRADAAPAEHPSSVRNIVLVGHTGAGKTTLAEALLFTAGAIPRMGRVEDGTTVSDHDEAEVRQQRSVALSLCSFTYAGVKVNLLDPPGYADFVGELRAGLRAADGALFVVSAADGIDGATQQLWDECADVGMPRAVVITRLDSPRADFERMVAICQRVLGDKHDSSVLPLYLPLESEDGRVGGLIGLLSQRIADYSSGTRIERDPDDEHIPLIADQRDALIEAIIAESEDETLMDRYLAGEDIDTKVLIDDLETAVARGSFYPVLAVAVPPQVGPDSAPVIGMTELLEVLTSAFPSPLEHEVPAVTRPDGRPHDPLVCDPEGPLVAEVVRTASDPYVGRVSLVRVFSGTLRPDAPVHVSGHAAGHLDHD